MLSPSCCAQELIKQLLFSEEADAAALDAYIVDRIAAGLAVTKMAGQTEQQRVEHHVGLMPPKDSAIDDDIRGRC